ncbi:hypothetical protein JHW43_009025 [Diplocarpon mali]|nr:hypothetical protein JHW43_009025 [Diplocarpon mali]
MPPSAELVDALELVDAQPESPPHQDPPPDVPPDVPPDGGYGWLVVAGVALVNAHTWGINSSYGVFLAHYLSSQTFPGATSLEYAFVGGLSISLALVVAPVATVCVARFGTQVTLSIGILLEAAGLLGASWAARIWQLFLSQGVAFGFGMGFLFVASVGLIPQWFGPRRSFANSIAAAGSGIGGLVYSLATNAMIQSVGLAGAFRILALVAGAVNLVCTILIRDRHQAVGSVHMAFHWPLFKRLDFLLLLGWGFFSMLGYIVLLFSLPNYARSVGLSASQGSVIGALLNLGQGKLLPHPLSREAFHSHPPTDQHISGVGRPFVGYFSDSFGRINMAGAGTFLAGLFCLVIWTFAKSYGVLIFFAVIVGTVSGTYVVPRKLPPVDRVLKASDRFWATVGPVGAEVVGIKILPSALSIMWLFLVLPCTFSEPIGLKLRRDRGNIYLHAQLFTGLMYLAAALCMWGLRAWKIQELGERAPGREIRERETRDGDVVPRPGLSRHARRIGVKSTVEAARGLWSWQRV